MQGNDVCKTESRRVHGGATTSVRLNSDVASRNVAEQQAQSSKFRQVFSPDALSAAPVFTFQR
eukprot:51265-Pleurochrysis_carterae.AAC.1